MTNRFPEYLKQARLSAGIRTQKEAVNELGKLGRKVSQGLIAQYETGKIKDPDPAILCLLARIYKRDYMEMIFHLIRDKYGFCESRETDVDSERWNLWENALRRFEKIGCVDGLEVHQLRAKTALLRQEILNVEGLAEWEKNYPELEVVWVVASNSLNDKGSKILESVIHNIRRDVQLVYFLQNKDVEAGGRFWQLERTLSSSGETKLRPPVAVPLGEEELGWLNTDIIIANPHWQEHSAGFKYIRRGRAGASYAIRMSPFELGDMISVLRRYAARNVGQDKMDKVLPGKIPESIVDPELVH